MKTQKKPLTLKEHFAQEREREQIEIKNDAAKFTFNPAQFKHEKVSGYCTTKFIAKKTLIGDNFQRYFNAPKAITIEGHEQFFFDNSERMPLSGMKYTYRNKSKEYVVFW